MKRSLIFFGACMLLLLLQGAVVRSTGLHFDVAALVVVYLALQRAVVAGAGLSLAVGYLSDLFAGTDRGLYAAAAVGVFFGVRLLVSRFTGDRLLFVSGVAVAATATNLALAALLEHLLGPGGITFAGSSPALPSLLIGAALLGYPCFRLLKKVDERFKEPDDDLVFRD